MSLPTSDHPIEAETVGFLGTGIMGTPMARNLVAAGLPVLAWSRDRAKAEAVPAATVASSVDEVFAGARVVVLMLAGESAVNTVLRRHSPGFRRLVAGHVVVHMGTTSPEYSTGLALDVEAAGGAYVEAPVSGSRVPAERGELVVMLAGEPEVVAQVRPLLTPLAAAVHDCGAVPNALRMKLAVNLFLITLVTGLAESFQLAAAMGLDTERFAAILDGGQMSSPVSRIKVAKMRDRDFEPQAALADVLWNAELVASAARTAGLSTPLLDDAHELFAEAVAAGQGHLDMAAVLTALEARSAGDAPS